MTIASTPGSAAPQCGEPPSRDALAAKKAPPKPRGWYSRGYLPHCDSSQVIQSIAYRLNDSLPTQVLERMQADIRREITDPKTRDSAVRRLIEDYLDAGHGSCILREPAVAECILDTWLHFDGTRYRLLEWVVMPNHCLVLIESLPGIALATIVLSWKNFTARFINRLRSPSGAGTAVHGRVWERDYWDRYIRNDQHLAAARHYIRMNPVKAGLVKTPEDWPWGSAGMGFTGEP
ncbi:transposase [uncultured Thiodictyon sp.]|uniref:REP-associated tyrosine transposase n=1 Tax=uncultured Thiodictyon sp. TaxID=1846217 RepID=UPI0025FF76E9|nr:transposase [uncultured Thiodictyon sp.]